jgi:hypothetical protein
LAKVEMALKNKFEWQDNSGMNEYGRIRTGECWAVVSNQAVNIRRLNQRRSERTGINIHGDFLSHPGFLKSSKVRINRGVGQGKTSVPCWEPERALWRMYHPPFCHRWRSLRGKLRLRRRTRRL